MSIVDANEIRTGNIISYKNERWIVTDYSHIQPGRRASIVQLILKNIKTGSKSNERLGSDDRIEILSSDFIEQKFSYIDGLNIFLTNPDTYELEEYSLSLIDKEKALFLQDEMPLKINFIDNEPFSIELPEKIPCEITETSPYIKGQTAKSSFKPAKVAINLEVAKHFKIAKDHYIIQVPEFLSTGDKIIININTMEYQEKYKEK
jgi:elongation factor P